MGRSPAINEELGRRLIEAFQRLGSKSAAAREVGVSEGAARRYLSKFSIAATPLIASQRQLVETVASSIWDTRRSLEENYERMLGLVNQAQMLDLANPKSVQALTGVYRELRAHIETSLSFAKLMIDVEQVQLFQRAVLEAISEADDATRTRIINKLRDRGALEFTMAEPRTSGNDSASRNEPPG